MDSLIAGNISRCVPIMNDILYSDWKFLRSLKRGESGA